jgi:hypothetical protein
VTKLGTNNAKTLFLSDTFLTQQEECSLDIFQFMRERILPVHVVIAMSVGIAFSLDFCAPKGPFLAWLSYGLTAILLCVILLEYTMISRVRSWRASRSSRLSSSLQKLWMGESYAWQSPAWQAIAMMTLVILGLGQISRGQQDEGGILGGRFIIIANAQEKLFGINLDPKTAATRMSEINQQIHDFGKAAHFRSSSDALSKGSWSGLQQFLQAGNPLPDAIRVYGGSSYVKSEVYELAEGLAHHQQGRINILEAYLKAGWDMNTASRIPLIERHLSKLIANTANQWINERSIDVHPYKPGKLKLELGRCKLSLLDVAILTKDHIAIDWLIKNGSDPDTIKMCVTATTEFSFTSRQLARQLRITLF